MLRAIAFAAVLGLAWAARPLTDVKSLSGEGKEFDYFILVRQWPGTFCSQNSCPLLHERGYHFTIHGLWPNYNDGSYPQFCHTEVKFDEAEVEDLEDVLQAEWPSFMSSNAAFWEHEWSKHGTCALNVLPDEHKFFKTVVKTHWKYDLAAAFRRANILPSRETTYRKSELVDAIQTMYGVRPLVHCVERKLSEIWMCIGKDLQPFDCDPAHEHPGCDSLTIPPLMSLEGREQADAEEDGRGRGAGEEVADAGEVAEVQEAAVGAAEVA